MTAPLGQIVIYTTKLDRLADFYAGHFGFDVVRRDGDPIVELRAAGGGATILLHPAARGQRQGQSLVKLVFDGEDVPSFCDAAAKRGLGFCKVHHADCHAFTNATDPAMNSVQVSSRAFAL